MDKSMGAHGRYKANYDQIVAYPESEAEAIGSYDLFCFVFLVGDWH